jgi:hypothetical protein
MSDDGRFAGIESRLGSIETEQRIHLRWMLQIAIALLAVMLTGFGMMVGGFGLVMGRIDRTEDRFARLEDRIGRLETAIAEVPGRISQNLNQLNQTLLQAVMAGATQRTPTPLPLPPLQQPPNVPAPQDQRSPAEPGRPQGP